MQKHKVEFEFDLNTIAAAVAVISAIAGALWWFFAAHASHQKVEAMPPPPELHEQKEIIEKLAEGQLQLQQEEQLRQELWGDSYRKKISSIVDEYDEKNTED